MFSDHNDTIVALATPAGTGAIGVIRVSGPEAITLCNKIFRGKYLEKQRSHTIHFGEIMEEGQVVDEVLVSIFIAPNSYTKEDSVEISCHGSPFILQRVIELLIDGGARMARPGEFTLRAFLNGRMDLSQAEAVADLIAADSEASHANALRQMRGGFAGKIKDLRERLVHFASMIELELDFSEEDVEFADRDELMRLVMEIQSLIVKLVDSFKLGNAIKNGISTVIAGRPNAGKSTLLNTLLQEDRAIVSEIPGTTRDTIEEVVNIHGVLFRLIDTAGIRDASDKIEAIGIERTMEKIRQSAIILYLFDVNEISPADLKSDLKRLESGELPVVMVGNKIDMVKDMAACKQKFEMFENLIFVSSKNEIHIDELKKKLYDLIVAGSGDIDGTIVSNARHYQSLRKANEALNAVLTGLQAGVTGDLLAIDIRRALHSLGEITGEITTDDLLDNIFSKFCIGK